MFTQTHESHLEEKTKLYDELRQQFDKVLEQKVEQVRGPPPAVYTDLHTHTEPMQVQYEEDSKKEEEEDMKVVMEPHTLSVRHNQVFLPLQYSSPSIIRTLDYQATLIFIMNIIIIYKMADLL